MAVMAIGIHRFMRASWWLEFAFAVVSIVERADIAPEDIVDNALDARYIIVDAVD